jgi:hypothetical protein
LTRTSGRQATISVGRVLVEGHDEIDGGERREDGHPVGLRVEGPVLALPRRRTEASELTATTSDGAEAARLVEVRDVAAMQDVEHAVGEHQRPRQRADARSRSRRWRSSPDSAREECRASR